MRGSGSSGAGSSACVHAVALEQLVRRRPGRGAGHRDLRRGPVERAAAMAADARCCGRARTSTRSCEEVDAVWVCTWTAAHQAVVAAAAQAGRAVFCEKPLAPDAGGLRGRRRAARAGAPPGRSRAPARAGVPGSTPSLVASGRYGRPLVAVLRDDQYFPIQGMYGSDVARRRRARPAAGTLIEHSIHDIDVLRWILGDPDVGARRRPRRASGTPASTTSRRSRFRYPDGGAGTSWSASGTRS